MTLSIERFSISLVIAAMLGLIVWPALAVTIGAAAVPLAVLLGGLAGWLALRRLPVSMDGVLKKRRTIAFLWSVLAVITIVQTTRLSSYMADAERDWWVTAKHEFWTKHMCMTAYFYAADLNRQGEPNVYDPAHYPGLNPEAEIHTTVTNLSPEDPYQYPPQFLLLPRLAIALSNDFFKIRPVWFALQALFFLLVAFLMARWYGGSAGMVALGLIPLMWISVPSMLNFQYGQFHVTTIALAVAAFLAFERRRDSFGGSLLAASILSKGFPGIVLIPLLLQRRWRAAAWTGLWSAGFTVLAWIVLGPEPFQAFLTHHLPNLRNGSAFAFEEAWPDLRAFLLAGNISPFAMIRKLGDLGVGGMTDGLARVIHGIFSISFLGIAVVSARLRSPRHRALGWFALLNLAAMSSPGAWGDYVPIGTFWMLTLLTADSERVQPAVLASVGVFCLLLPGVVPIGSFPAPNIAMALSIVGTLLLIGMNGWIVTRRIRGSVRTSLPSR